MSDMAFAHGHRRTEVSIERLDPSQLDEVYREQRLNRIPRGCDQQGRQPQAAEACTEVGADAPRNDASLWREWCDFIESLLPPGVRIGSMLRGLFWIAVAFALVGGGVALAVSALRGGIGT